MVVKDTPQVPVDVLGAHVADAERDDTRQIAARRGEQIAKTKVMGEDYSVLSKRLVEDVRIGEAMEPQIAEMDCIVAESGQKGD